MKLHMGDTAADLHNVALALESAAAATQQVAAGYAQPYSPGSTMYAPQTYYPGGVQGYAAPPGTYQGGVNTTVPVIPVALGAAAGWYWKKSPLAAIVGAIAGFILGNLIGSVSVQSQVQATPLQPSNTPYGY